MVGRVTPCDSGAFLNLPIRSTNIASVATSFQVHFLLFHSAQSQNRPQRSLQRISPSSSPSPSSVETRPPLPWSASAIAYGSKSLSNYPAQSIYPNDFPPSQEVISSPSLVAHIASFVVFYRHANLVNAFLARLWLLGCAIPV